MTILWTLQGSACIWRSFELRETATDACEGRAIACGTVGFHAAVLLTFYFSHRTRSRLKGE